MIFTLTHDIECGADRFWELMVSTDFSRRLFAFLDVPDWDVEQEDEGDEIIRRVKARPKTELPGPLARIFGSSFGYRELTRFDKKKKEFTFVITTSFSDKIKNQGVIRAEPRGDGRCRRIAELVHEANVIGIGGFVGRSMEKMTRVNSDKAVDFVNRWVREHP